MSEYTVVELEFKDDGALKQVIKNLGYEFETHEEAQTLFDYRGKARPEKAHIIIRRKNVSSAANDIGFVKKNGKYEMIISEYDRGHAKTKENFMQKLNQEYSQVVTKKQIQKMGMIVKHQTVDNQGRIKIKVQVLN